MSPHYEIASLFQFQDILGTPLDYSKVEKHTADAKLEQGDIKIVIAIIAFFITNAAKNDVDPDTLSTELQQLGLPKGTCAVGRVCPTPFAHTACKHVGCLMQSVVCVRAHNFFFF